MKYSEMDYRGTHSVAWRVFRPEGGVLASEAPSLEEMCSPSARECVGPSQSVACDASYLVLIYRDKYPVVLPTNRPGGVNPRIQLKLGASIVAGAIQAMEHSGVDIPDHIVKAVEEMLEIAGSFGGDA